MLTWTADSFSIIDHMDRYVEKNDGMVSNDNRFGIRLRDSWAELTHIASGKRIAHRRTLGEACALAEKLITQLPGVDWYNENPDFSKEDEATFRFLVKG